jgi:hypothetical protein
MQREETKSRDCGESERVACTAELTKTGAGALIATGTTPAWARAHTAHERSEVREAWGCE